MSRTIPLTKGQCAIVDDQDYEWLVMYRWYCRLGRNNRMDACRMEPGTRRCIYMHRMIASPPEGKVVDHKNGNTLDNTRSNLRVCGHSENNMNKRTGKNNTSGVRGVNWHRARQRWVARISINGKEKHLGYFRTIEEASKIYRQFENDLFGEFSYSNSRFS